ncbi:MAG: hypothetical protein E3J66_03490 [Dehalococcoidia bacterium]|nr:MAG: hypothetical protein E3J66_03490 [Dehalococcoidia bacterium]
MSEEQTQENMRRWRKFQEHLGYTDEELAIHRSNPKHVKALENAPKLAKYKTVIEVIESHNCAAGYKVGDKFVVDTEGCLVPNECPPRLCVSAIAAFKPLVSRMWQAFYADGTEIFQDTVRCPDVGVHRGGWGEITMRIYAVPKEPKDK